MIVTTTKLQRTITLTGIEKVKQIGVDASGYLKRLNRSPREAESVLNLVGRLKSELDRVPSHEQGEIALDVTTEVSRVWLTVLVEYTRTVTLLERKVAQQPELGGIRGANSAEDAANKLAAQMQDQLNLPIQNLDSIIAEQEKREKEADKEFAKGTASGPHRGVGTAAKTDEGLAEGDGQPADPRSRRGPKTSGKKWDRTHKKKEKAAQPELPPVQDKRDGPASKEDVVPLAE